MWVGDLKSDPGGVSIFKIRAKAPKLRKMARKRGRAGTQIMDIWKFANRLEQSLAPHVANMPNVIECSKKEMKQLVGRLVLLEIDDDADNFCAKSHMLSVVVGPAAGPKNKGKWVIQPHNQSGDPDGRPDAERPGDIWLLPYPKEILKLTDRKKIETMQVLRYNLASSTVCLDNLGVNTGGKKAKPTTKKKPEESVDVGKKKAKPTTKKKPEESVDVGKKKAKPTPEQTTADKKRKKQSLDAPSSSTAESVGESADFTLDTVLKAFGNPRDDLFTRYIHIRALIYVHSYMCTHICTLIYVHSYMCTHI